MRIHLSFLACMVAVLPDPLSAAGVTTGSLLREMIDLNRLAEFPNPAYRTVQFSSTDRRSQLPGGPEWYANSDGFGGEPQPNFAAVVREPDAEGVGEYLICDVEGPGAIVRVWTARISGTVRLHLDGSETAVFDGPAEDFFLRPYAPYLEGAGVEESVLDGALRQRQACYFPIPFAQRCRLLWTGKLGSTHFYEVQIRRYEPGTPVTSFAREDLRTYRQDLLDVVKVLRDPDAHWVFSAQASAAPIAATLPPGQVKDVLELKGPQRVERLTLRVQASDLDRALRQTVLHLLFDGHPWGQVQCPMGDFFGAAPGVNPYQSIPFTVRPSGEMICRYVMPFAQSMKVRLENQGDQPVTVTGSVLAGKCDWLEDRSMHFRARWRVTHDLINTSPYDLPFLLANGQGVYVGTASILMNPCPVPTSYGNWWGEGDEKIFVDDDRLPSTFGTGSEDYYNYAWSSPDIFLYPYCGQPRNDGPDNRGFVTNFRWHVLDAIPFRSRLAFYMEFYSHERTPGYSYARIGYHYGRPGLMDDHVPLTPEDVRHLKLPPWQPEPRGAAQNALFYQIEALAPAHPNVRLVPGPLFAGGQLWVWHPRSKSDSLEVPVPVAEDGAYVIGFTARRDPNSGTFSAELDGQPLDFGRPALELYQPYRTLLRNFLSKPVELKQGAHALRLRPEGAWAEGTEIGIDFLWVQKK